MQAANLWRPLVQRLLLAVCCFAARIGYYRKLSNYATTYGLIDYLSCGQHGCKVDHFFKLGFVVTEAQASAIPN